MLTTRDGEHCARDVIRLQQGEARRVETPLPVSEQRRVDEAAKYVPLERLAISPQCGFGSDAVGNLLSEDDQKRKLELVVEARRQIWR